MYALDSLLLEGFGAGAYSAAVAALMAYRPPSRAEYSKFELRPHMFGGHCYATSDLSGTPQCLLRSSFSAIAACQ